MRWVGRRELDYPLDFHSLSEKTPPNYQITGHLGCGSGMGATLQLLPLPPQVLGLPGIRASTRSPQTQRWIHTQGGHLTRTEQVDLASLFLHPAPHLLVPSRLPLLLSSLSWALLFVVLGGAEGRGSER